jgi:hypothetical protein
MTAPTMDLATLRLLNGSHGDEDCGQYCLVEASNRIAAGVIAVPPALLPACPLAPAPFADDHPSISRVVRMFAIGLNDAWDDEQRQKLVPYAPRLLCTATGLKDEETRAWLATDWLARVQAPAWLRLAGLEEHARALESLARIVDPITAQSAQPALNRARGAADAARGAAGDAARDAAWAAAWAAAGDAAWAAARAAAGDAAWAAATDRLAPTVAALQDAALVLLDDMLAVGRGRA